MIHYPCETAAVFNGVVFVINPKDKFHIAEECDRAYQFYRNLFPRLGVNKVLTGMRFSFGGQYLTLNDIQRESMS